MKKVMKHYTALLLIIYTLSVCSCQQEQAIEDVTGSISDASASSEAAASNRLPELDFDGKEFRIMTFDPATLTWARAELDIAEQTGDIMDDAIYDRNRAVEERLNIEIVQLTRPYGDNDLAKMRQWIMSGDDLFEVGMEFVNNSRTLAMEGLLVDYGDLKYVDLSREWWCQDLNRSTSLAGKHYLVYGDYSISTHDNTSVLIFNKELYNDLAFDESLYDIVERGEWTYDEMNEKLSAAVADLNGDSVMDESDRYGYVSEAKEVLPSFWVAAGETTIDKDASDIPCFQLDQDVRFADVIDGIFDLMLNGNHWYNITNVDNGLVSDIFINNQALLSHATLFAVEKLRDMDSDFGIIPYPKYDTEQTEYYSRVGGGQFGVIPLTNSDLDFTGAVMEALSSESRMSVIPAYYNIALTSKYSRDDESAGMLDIIFQNRVYDLGDTFWVTLLRDGIFRKMMTNGDRNLASAIQSVKSQVEASIAETIEGILNN